MFSIYHMDLYRLSGSSEKEFSPLNLPYVFSSCVSLIEWPVRLPTTLLPSHDRRMDVTITIKGTDSRGGGGDYHEAVKRIVCIESHDALWSSRIEQLIEEGHLDDLLVE
jgi:tRNA A37 threonylcarbamoyladenosine biosynthesis protein TsaE